MNFLSFNAIGMKNHNKYAVLKYIRKGYLSRADISRLTNLTRASITYIVDDLCEAGLVIEGEYKQKKVGKRSIQLSINPKAGYAIGVSITRGLIQLSVINMACEVVRSDTISDDNLSLNESLEAISEILSSYIKKYSKKILGIGFTCPGPVDEVNGKIINPIKMNKWHYFDICEYFSDRFKIKCFLKKDINSYALIEKTFNKELDGCDFLDIIADRGIGSSVILDDRLLVGNGFGVELGHVSIDPINGKPCQCGSKGCIEQYASTNNILQYSKECGYDYTKWEEIVDDFLSCDTEKRDKAKVLIDKMVFYYGEVLSTFENILNIGTVVITGSLAYRSEVLFDSIENYINSHILAKNLKRVRLLKSIIEDIEEKAAGNIVLEEFFNGNLI